MPYFIGVSLALVVALFGTAVGFDRDRAFYATVLIVVATYYGLFAVMGGSMQTLLVESIVIVAFGILSVLGFKFNQWFLVAGLFGHGFFDFFHGHMILNAGMPLWWPKFCLSYDVTAAAYLAGLILIRHRATRNLP